MTRKPEERIVYDSYDLWDQYAMEAREFLAENWDRPCPTDDEIWIEIYHIDELNFWEEYERLKEFFDGEHCILMGAVGLWNGNYAAGTIFTNFDEMYRKATRDCDSVKIWDENGHLYLECSHHDGTNCFEIKIMTKKGIEYYENWEYGNDKRTEAYVHGQIMKRYSRLPHFAHKVYGCEKVKYEVKAA